MTAKYDPAEVERLVREAREDDARMTRAPWTTPTGTRFLGAVSAIIGGVERQVAASAGQAPQFDDVPDVGRALADNASAIARTRNNLRAVADQLEAARAEVEALTVARNADRTEWMTTYEAMRAEIEALRCGADRSVTIADEAFGLGPVEPLDATLSRIERGIFEQHKLIAEQSVLIEVLRFCDNLGLFHDNEMEPAQADAFREHLKRCDRCRERLVGMAQEHATLSTEGR